MLYLQLFAASGLETADFGNMESLSNHMGLFLQVCIPFVGPHSSHISALLGVRHMHCWAASRGAYGLSKMLLLLSCFASGHTAQA